MVLNLVEIKMSENNYWIEQQLYDGSWARLSSLYTEERIARSAWSSANWFHPTQKFRIIKETRSVLEI